MVTKEYFSWEDFDRACEALAFQIRQSDRLLTAIYGEPRGGLVLAVKLSHLLDLPVIMEGARPLPKSTLIVDDISDTGRTLFFMKREGYKIATLHYVETSKVRPDFYASVRKADWVVYPWEKE